MLRCRPAALLCLAVTAGIAVGLRFAFWLTLLVMALAWSLTMLIRPARRFRILLIVSAAVFGLGSLYGAVYDALNTDRELDAEATYFFEGIVTEARPTGNGNRATIDIVKSNDGLEGKSVYIYTDELLETCDGVTVDARLKEANIASKGNGVDYNAFGSVNKNEKVKPEGLKYRLLSVRKRVSDQINSNFSKDSAGFYNAIITGDRSGIDDNLNGSFARSGLSHILAISGQHFSILVYSIYSFLMITVQRKKLASGICLGLAVLYTLIVGATPPILRACIMCCTVFAANMAGVYADSITVLCGALAAIVVCSPYASASVGLQLSFLATLGILTLSESKSRRKVRSKAFALFVTPTLVTFAANLFCMPVLLCSFDFVSIIAPLSNLAVNFIIGPSLAVSVISLPVFMLFPNFRLLADINGFIYHVIKYISDWASSLSFATFSASLPYIKLVAIPATAAIICALALKKKHIIKSAALCMLGVALIVVACSAAHTNSLERNSLLYVCDSASNAYVFYCKGTDTVLIDGYGTEKCSGVILERGVTHLDGYVVTDCTEDSKERLLQTLSYLSIGTVYIPERYGGESFERDIAETGCDVLYYERELTAWNMTVKESRGHFALQTKNDCVSISLLGGNETGFSAPCDTLIVMEKCGANELPRQFVPKDYKNLLIYKTRDTYFTESLKQNAKTVTAYDKSIELRFGEDGLEVKE